MAATVCLVLSIIILPIALLPLVLTSYFSGDELKEMDVRYELPSDQPQSPARETGAVFTKTPILIFQKKEETR